jgi:hypothetical protein
MKNLTQAQEKKVLKWNFHEPWVQVMEMEIKEEAWLCAWIVRLVLVMVQENPNHLESLENVDE